MKKQNNVSQEQLQEAVVQTQSDSIQHSSSNQCLQQAPFHQSNLPHKFQQNIQNQIQNNSNQTPSKIHVETQNAINEENNILESPRIQCSEQLCQIDDIQQQNHNNFDQNDLKLFQNLEKISQKMFSQSFDSPCKHESLKKQQNSIFKVQKSKNQSNLKIKHTLNQEKQKTSIKNIKEQNQMEQIFNSWNEIMIQNKSENSIEDLNVKKYTKSKIEVQNAIQMDEQLLVQQKEEQLKLNNEKVARRDKNKEEQQSDSPLITQQNQGLSCQLKIMNNLSAEQPQPTDNQNMNILQHSLDKDELQKQSQFLDSLGQKVKVMANLKINFHNNQDQQTNKFNEKNSLDIKNIGQLQKKQIKQHIIPFQDMNSINKNNYDIQQMENNKNSENKNYDVENISQNEINNLQNQFQKNENQSVQDNQQKQFLIEQNNIKINKSTEINNYNKNEQTKNLDDSKILDDILNIKQQSSQSQLQIQGIQKQNDYTNFHKFIQKQGDITADTNAKDFTDSEKKQHKFLVGKEFQFLFKNRAQNSKNKFQISEINNDQNNQQNNNYDQLQQINEKSPILIINQDQNKNDQFKNKFNCNLISNQQYPIGAIQKQDDIRNNSPLNFGNRNFLAQTPQQNNQFQNFLFQHKNNEKRLFNTGIKNTLLKNNISKLNQQSPFLRIYNQQNDKQFNQFKMNLYKNKLKKRILLRKNKQKDTAFVYFENDKKFLKFSYNKKENGQEQEQIDENIEQKKQITDSQNDININLKEEKQQSINNHISSDSTKLQEKNNTPPQNNYQLKLKNLQLMESPSFGENQSIEMVLSSLKKTQLIELPTKFLQIQERKQVEQYDSILKSSLVNSNKQITNFMKINDEIISKFLQNESDIQKNQGDIHINSQDNQTENKDQNIRKLNFENLNQYQEIHNQNQNYPKKNYSYINISNSSNSLDGYINKDKNIVQDIQKQQSTLQQMINKSLPQQQSIQKSQIQQKIETFQNQLRLTTNRSLSHLNKKDEQDVPKSPSEIQRKNMHKDIQINDKDSFYMNLNKAKSPIQQFQKTREFFLNENFKTPNNQIIKNPMFQNQSKDSLANSLFGKHQNHQINPQTHFLNQQKYQTNEIKMEGIAKNQHNFRQINQNFAQKQIMLQRSTRNGEQIYPNNLQNYNYQIKKASENQNEQIWQNECNIMNQQDEEQSIDEQEYIEAKNAYENERKQLIGIKRKRQISMMNEKDVELKSDDEKCDFDQQNNNFENMENQQIRYMLTEENQHQFIKQQHIINQNIMTTQKLVLKSQIPNSKIREEIPDGAEVFVEYGDTFNFDSIKIDEEIPSTRKFKVYKYKNPRTQRNVKILNCNHDNCDMFFRKWHNFFDHLRVHTGERPFKCNESGCNQSFTQKANLNKHLAVHLRRKRQKCPMCCKIFASSYILKMHMRQHTFNLTHPTQNQLTPFLFPTPNVDICNSSVIAQESNFNKTQSSRNNQKQTIDFINNTSLNKQVFQKQLIQNKRQKISCYAQDQFLMNKDAQHNSTSTSTPSPIPYPCIGIQGRAHVNTFNGRINQITRNILDQFSSQNLPKTQDFSQNNQYSINESQKLDRRYFQNMMQHQIKKTHDNTDSYKLKQNIINDKLQKISSSSLLNGISLKNSRDVCFSQIANKNSDITFENSQKPIIENQINITQSQSSNEEDLMIERIIDSKQGQNNRIIKKADRNLIQNKI